MSAIRGGHRAALLLSVACLWTTPLACSNGDGTADAGSDAGSVDGGTGDAGDVTTNDTGADAGKVDVPTVDLPPVFINELAAKGSAIGTFNPTGSDWAELYNGSDEEISLQDWRIIDSKSKGFGAAFTLPPSTKLAAKGYLVVYFNHEGAGTPVIDKKLGGDEALSIYHPSGALVDVVNWEPPDSVPKKSWGRSPDGGSVFVVFDKPTPNAANN